MRERRTSIRQKSFLRGFVSISKKHGALGCLIRDISDHGARIILSDTVALPDVVDLYIPQRDKTLRARVHWRRNDEVGLAFTETADIPAAAPPPALGEEATVADVIKRMALLETEIAALRGVLERLGAAKLGAADDAA